ncbi:MAG: SufE family protein [Verrucomicrobia bacterium]|nr:SufE family protein [Verrucomicrobiota bacterium]
MTLAEKKNQLLATLAAIRDGQERFAWVVAQGRRHPMLEPSLKTDANKVEGCLANLWLAVSHRDGIMLFQCDSDSAVVKGVAALLCDFYSGQRAEEILTVEPSFLREAGITQHLTANRRNALARVWEKISAAARAELPPAPQTKP